MARKRRDRDEAVPESRKHLHLSRRDREQRKMLLGIAVPLLVLAVGILVVGAYRELIQKPNTPVAEVNGENIATTTFATRLQYERRLLLNYVNNIAQLALSSDPSFINNLATGQRQQLTQTTLDKLIDEAIIRQEATARKVTVADADVDTQIYNELATAMAPPQATGVETTETPTAAPTSAGKATTATGKATSASAAAGLATAAITPTLETTAAGATATVTATSSVTQTVTPVPTSEIGRKFDSSVQPLLDQLGMTRAQYRDIVRQQVFHDKMNKLLGDEIKDKEKQVQAEYLLFKDKETADKAASALAAGASWDSVSKQYGPTPTPAAGASSQPTVEPLGTPTPAALSASGTPQAPPTPTPEPYAFEAGKLDWYTKDSLVTKESLKAEDADAVLALLANGVSKALAGSRGTFVFHVVAVDDNREVPAADLKTRRDKALDDWLKQRKDELTKADKIKRFPLEAAIPPEPDWFKTGFDQVLNQAQPTLNPDMLSVSTTAPGAAPVGTAAPAAPPPVPMTVQSP